MHTGGSRKLADKMELDKWIMTREVAWQVQMLGACSVPEIGKKFSALSQLELSWAHDNNFAVLSVPLWAAAYSGYGYGGGCGYGDGGGLVLV